MARPEKKLRAVGGVPSTESVRERILNTARELFYKEGFNTVGVDTVVARSGVAKTSLYRWFPSKDALIVAVLEEEAKDRWAGWDRVAEHSSTDPHEQLRAQLTEIVRCIGEPGFRGCPFTNVSAEFADVEHPVRAVARRMHVELRRRVRALVEQIGVHDVDPLTDALLLLFYGAFTGAQIACTDGPQSQLVAAADALICVQRRRTTSSRG